MAKTKVSEWSTTPSSNTDIDGINIAEGCAPSGINDAIRDMMAQIRSWQSGTYGDTFNGPVNGTVGATTPATGAFTTLSASSTVTLSGGTANGVTYLNGSKVLTSGSALTFDGSNLAVTGGLITATKGSANGITIGDVSTNSNSVLRLQGTSSGYNFQLANNLNVGGFELTPSTATGGVTYTTPVYSVTGLGVHAWSAGGSEQMRLTSTGLGIGTSSVSSKLDIVGANKTNANEYGTITAWSSDSYAADKGGSLAFWGKYNSSSGNACFGRIYGAKENGTDGSFLGYLGFSTSPGGTPVERMRLDSAGNLGLGVTPSAWSVSGALQLKGGTSLYSYATTDTTIGNNVYYNSGQKYLANGTASFFQQYQGAFYWSTAASGTAGNAITFTQAMTLSSAGNLLVGTTSDSGNSLIKEIILKGPSNGVARTQVTTNSGVQAHFGVSEFSSANIGFIGTLTANPFQFLINDSEVGRWDTSGNLLVGTTTAQAKITTVTTGNAVAGFFKNDASGYQTITVQNAGGSGTRYLEWFVAGTTDVGSISSNGTITTYNTTSDYRLKTNQAPLTESGAFIDSLKPKTWTWVQDNSKGVGFIAHEFAEVSPSSVSGEKDAVDENGNPVYQSMQASSAEVIANLVAEVQSLRKRLADAGL